MEYKMNVQKEDRKNLVKAMGEILGQKPVYLKMPTVSFQIGNYIVDKFGTISGEENPALIAGLAERGFAPEPCKDKVCIEYPLDGLGSGAIENLKRMVAAKETLLKKALGATALPIEVLSDKVRFDWFETSDSEHIAAYSQLVMALCESAKKKVRVTAQPRKVSNEKYAMHVFAINLGLIGSEYKLIRKLLGQRLTGHTAFSGGFDPRKMTPVPVVEESTPEMNAG